jgi:hypothetical protein
MSDFKIIDNFLHPSDAKKLQEEIMSPMFPWGFADKIAGNENGYSNQDIYFLHTIYDDNKPCSNTWNMMMPFLDFLKPKALIRAKVNMYLPTEELYHHHPHVDQMYPHYGALYYVNDNDGVTTMHDGTEVESVANRLVLFDSSLEHSSSSCTNAQRRVTINFNYL